MVSLTAVSLAPRGRASGGELLYTPSWGDRHARGDHWRQQFLVAGSMRLGRQLKRGYSRDSSIASNDPNGSGFSEDGLNRTLFSVTREDRRNVELLDQAFDGSSASDAASCLSRWCFDQA
jgi:hypothetical protein